MQLFAPVNGRSISMNGWTISCGFGCDIPPFFPLGCAGMQLVHSVSIRARLRGRGRPRGAAPSRRQFLAHLGFPSAQASANGLMRAVSTANKQTRAAALAACLQTESKKGNGMHWLHPNFSRFYVAKQKYKMQLESISEQINKNKS